MKPQEFRDMLIRALPVEQYLRTCSVECRPKYEARRAEYTPNPKVLDAIKDVASQFIIVAIGADWCKDCVANIPILDLIQEATGLRVYILGGVKTDPLNPNKQWAVPPSPPEVDTLNISAIPTILIYSTEGNEFGRIVENPEFMSTLEEELLHYMQQEKRRIER
ncbi:MAG: thioredoxin family protein [Candidatus Thorarchaeota archaeon]